MPRETPEEIPEYEVVLYQCLDEGLCGAIFARPQCLLMYGEHIEACPECHGHDFAGLPNEVAWAIFWEVITREFTQEEWETYRMVVQAGMSPSIELMDNDD